MHYGCRPGYGSPRDAEAAAAHFPGGGPDGRADPPHAALPYAPAEPADQRSAAAPAAAGDGFHGAPIPRARDTRGGHDSSDPNRYRPRTARRLYPGSGHTYTAAHNRPGRHR